MRNIKLLNELIGIVKLRGIIKLSQNYLQKKKTDSKYKTFVVILIKEPEDLLGPRSRK